MKRFVDNPYLDALLKTMLFSASVHMIILFVLAIATHNWQLLNYFDILDIDRFAPAFVQGNGNFVLGVVVVCFLFGIFYFTSKKR